MTIAKYSSYNLANEVCNICQEKEGKFVAHDNVHAAHPECLNTWFHTSNMQATCPMCRHVVDPNSILSLKERMQYGAKYMINNALFPIAGMSFSAGCIAGVYMLSKPHALFAAGLGSFLGLSFSEIIHVVGGTPKSAINAITTTFIAVMQSTIVFPIWFLSNSITEDLRTGVITGITTMVTSYGLGLGVIAALGASFEYMNALVGKPLGKNFSSISENAAAITTFFAGVVTSVYTSFIVVNLAEKFFL